MIYLDIFNILKQNFIHIYHTGPSFNTGTENTIQVSKFKRIGFEKKMADFDGGE